jgi:outer membrane receptor for ferrienterochelin and colicins
MRICIISLFLFWSSCLLSQTLCFRDKSGQPLLDVKVGLFYGSGNQETVYSESKGCLVIDTNDLVRLVVRNIENIEKQVKLPNDFPMILTFSSSTQDLSSVTATANYRNSIPEECVLSVETISAAEIEAMGAQNVSEVLKQSLNFRVGTDPVLGSSISFQGLGGQQVKVMIDGVPVVGRLNGQIDLSQIVTADIERIEIVEGPLSVDYGTDALAGTINIITKSGRTNSASEFAQYESSGQYNLGFNTTFSKKRKQLTLGTTRNFFDGWRDTDDAFHIEKKGPADTSRFQAAKPKEAYDFHWKCRSMLEEGKMDISLSQRFYQDVVYNLGLPQAPYEIMAFDEEYRTRRLDQQLQIKSGPYSNRNFTLLAAYNHFERVKNAWVNDLTNLQRNMLPGASSQDTTRFNSWMSRGNFSIGSDSTKHHLTLGYDVFDHKMNGQKLQNGVQKIYNLALFSILESKVTKRFDSRLGLRGAYNSEYNFSILPSAAGRWNFKNNNKTSLGFGMGFRAPEIKELYLEFVDVNHNIFGNENLNPEKSINVFLMHEKKWKRDQQTFELNGRAFANRVVDGISLVQSPNGLDFTYQNLSVQEVVGLQLRTGWYISNFKAELGGSFLVQNFPSEFPEPFYTPEISGNMTYSIKKWNSSVHLFYRHNGARRIPVLNAEEQIEYEIQNGVDFLDVSFQKEWFKGKMRLQVGAKNLFNVTRINIGNQGFGHQSTNGSLVGFGRVYYFKISSSITWKK